jgi:hypothetical protein
MVRCATEGCTTPEWLMHWPCEGSEEEIRNGKHVCVNCSMKAHYDRALADPVTRYPVRPPVAGVRRVDEGETRAILKKAKERQNGKTRKRA